MKKKALTLNRKLKLLEAWANATEVLNGACLKIQKNYKGEWEIWETYGSEEFAAMLAGGSTRSEAIEHALKRIDWLKTLSQESSFAKTASWSQVEIELAVRGIEV